MKKLTSFILIVIIILMASVPCVFAETSAVTEVTGSYYEAKIQGYLKYDMTADFGMFNADSREYNHELAKLSLLMTVSAFKNKTEVFADKDENIRSFFKQAGFQSYVAYDYDIKPTKDTIANTIAYRRLADDEGEYVLLAVPVCGAGYGDEWVSNLTIGTNEKHTGFDVSAKKVYDRVTEYIDKNLKGERIKVWISGFSRAAAVGNILAHLIISENNGIEPENVFAYSFGTPNTTTNPIEYKQIFNICNGCDMVAKVPLAEWGYNKYGITRYLPIPSTNENYKQLEAAALKVYYELTNLQETKMTLSERNWLLDEGFELIYRYMPTVDVYTEGYQEAMRQAWLKEGSITDKLDVFVETAKANNCDTSGYENIKKELEALIESTLDYSAGVIMNTESDSDWTSIMNSGSDLIHEHNPAIYMAWVFSSNNADELFGSSTRFTRICFTGKPEVTIVNRESGDEVFTSDSEDNKLSSVELRNTTFLDVPADAAYSVTITPVKTGELNIMLGTKEVRDAAFKYVYVEKHGFKKDDSIEITLPENSSTVDSLSILHNGETELKLISAESDVVLNAFLKAEKSAQKNNFGELITNIIGIIPEIIGFIIILAAALVILIKRVIKGKTDDRGEITRIGRILFYIVMAAAALNAVLMLASGFNMLFGTSADAATAISNKLLKKAADILGIGVGYYCLLAALLWALFAVLSASGIKHKKSRGRLMYLSILIIIIETVSTIIMATLGESNSDFIFCVIISAVAIAAVVKEKTAERKKAGKTGDGEQNDKL